MNGAKKEILVAFVTAENKKKGKIIVHLWELQMKKNTNTIERKYCVKKILVFAAFSRQFTRWCHQ